MYRLNLDQYSLEELENMFDKHYMYSDDHSVYMKNVQIQRTIRERKDALEKNQEK
jgi:hypothetical protein